MWKRWSKLCTFLSLVALASSSCQDTPVKRDAGSPIHHDAGRDLPLADLAADPARSEVALDLGADLPLDMDVDSPESGPDVLPDGVPGLPHDPGNGGYDVGLDLPIDLGNDPGALDGNSPTDGPTAPPLDLGVDSSLHPEPDVPSDAGAWACTSGEPYVLVVSGNNEGGLYRFYPDTVSLVRIGTLSCGTTVSELNSLAGLPVGPAYVSNGRGELCVVEPTTFVASLTTFDAGVISNHPYGMAMLPDNVPAGETLYIAVKSTGQADTLARVDLSTFGLTTVGPIQLHQDGGTQPCAGIELTAASNGGLYGFSVDTDPALLLAIDPKTGDAVKMAEVPVTNPGGFALVEWQGTIYLFFAESGARGSTVFTFRNGDTRVSPIGGIDTAVIGTGVALCH